MSNTITAQVKQDSPTCMSFGLWSYKWPSNRSLNTTCLHKGSLKRINSKCSQHYPPAHRLLVHKLTLKVLQSRVAETLKNIES